MHELSVAMNIVEITVQETSRAGSEKVLELELEIGSLSGVEREALEFALQVAVSNTILEAARITIHEIKPEACCNQCHHCFKVDDLFTACPECGSFDTLLIKGNELRVKSLLVE